jgi:uncharacterized protein
MNLSIARESNGNGTSHGSRRFRILALDGGGIKGTFTAAILAEWERSTGLRIAEHFDLIAGTSTGGILAIGLGIGLSAAELLDFYERRGPVIFPTTGFGRKFWRSVHQVVSPKYSGEVLHSELRAAFKGAKFGDSKVRLLIPAYDILRARLFLFKTAHHSRFTNDIDIPAADVALATAAAPTYFQAAKIAAHAGQGYVDGGVWANCPALAAVVESVSFLDKRLDDLDVVSIGTTFAPDSVKTLSGAGLFGWAPRIVNLLMNAQAEAARAQASLLVGEERFHRVDIATRPGDYNLDSSDQVKELAALGRSKAVEKAVLEPVRSRFLDGQPAVTFEPVVRV